MEENFQRSLDPIQQAEAARQASAAFLREIRSFGEFGIKLHTFVLRLGSLFQLAREDSKTSIAEQTHFSVNRGSGIVEHARFVFKRSSKAFNFIGISRTQRKRVNMNPRV